MAVNSIISRITDLRKPLVVETLDHVLVMGDSRGDRFEIAVTYGGEAASISGGSATGYFIRVENGKKLEDCLTFSIPGYISGNIVSVTLPESCYAVPGRFVFTVKVMLPSETHSIYVAEGAVRRATTDYITNL